MTRYSISVFRVGNLERIYVNGVRNATDKVYLNMHHEEMVLVAPGLDVASREDLDYALHDQFGIARTLPERERFAAFLRHAEQKPTRARQQSAASGHRSSASQAYGAPQPFGQDLAFENIKNERPIRIEVDHREPSEIVRHLERVKDCEVVVSTLDVADYRLNDGRILVERKSVRDFALSVQSSHIFDQAQRMGFEEGVVCVVIIEGDVFGEPIGMLASQITGAISCLTNVQGMNVFQTRNPEHTAYVLAKFAQHERNGLGYELTLRKDKPTRLLDAQRYVLEGFNGITTKMADRLLNHFGTVGKVLQASTNELRAVEGIGPKRAEQIHTLIHAPYRAE